MARENKFDKYYSGYGTGQGNGGQAHFEPPGDFESEQLSLSGSARVEKAMARHIRISGSATITNGVGSESFECSGSVHSGGNITSSTIRVSGSLDSGGSIRCISFHSSGSCRAAQLVYGESKVVCSGSMKAAEIESAGTVEINGSVHSDAVRAGRVEIGGGGSIGSLTCGTATINTKGKGRAALFTPFRRRRGELSIERIEASGSVDVDHCTVGEINASSVHVGSDCAVGKIMFKTDCRIEKGAEIGQEPQKV